MIRVTSMMKIGLRLLQFSTVIAERSAVLPSGNPWVGAWMILI